MGTHPEGKFITQSKFTVSRNGPEDFHTPIKINGF